MGRRLSERRDVSVLVLEAGGRDWSPYLRIPAGRIRMNDKYDWSYPAEPDPSRLNNADNWESGKVLGGSSSINGMIWVRGAPEDFDGWSRLGCEGWDYRSVLPYFRRAETFEGGGQRVPGRKRSPACLVPSRPSSVDGRVRRSCPDRRGFRSTRTTTRLGPTGSATGRSHSGAVCATAPHGRISRRSCDAETSRSRRTHSFVVFSSRTVGRWGSSTSAEGSVVRAACRARGHPLGWGVRVAEVVDAVGHRSRGTSA